MSVLENDSLRFYFAVYADPSLAGHVTIEGGCFGNRGMPQNMDVGDMVLLYCTDSYTGHTKSVPGVGIVTAVDHNLKHFWYDYVPFEEAVPLAFIRLAITEDDRTHVANMRREFLFQISRESFYAVTQAAKTEVT